MWDLRCEIRYEGFIDGLYQNPTSDINSSKILLIGCSGSG
jgi:hypothetical protein